MPVVNPLTGKTQEYFEGGEGLIPKKAVEKNRALVEALIDAGRKDGHLAPVNFRNLTRSMDALSMAKSGYWRNKTTAKPLSAGKRTYHKGNTESLHELIAIQKQLLAAVKEEKTHPAIISHRQ